MQVTGHADRVEPQPEHLDVLGFLERELRQVHLVAQPSLGAHCGHERLDVFGHRFLTGDELRAQPDGVIALGIRQLLPVLPVLREVDIGRIPELGVAAGEELQRQAVPVEAAGNQRAECGCVSCDLL